MAQVSKINMGGIDYDIRDKALEQEVAKIQPIVNQGTINNAADEEDLTSENNLLKLKDRPSLNGMGYVILRKNKSFAEQITQENTIYEIRYDYNLEGATITLPSNCYLDFKGGKIKNGKIIGGLINDVIFPEWFGAEGDGISDDSAAFQNAISSIEGLGKTIVLSQTYYIKTPLIIKDAIRLIGRYNSKPYSTYGLYSEGKAISLVAASGVEIENIRFVQKNNVADVDAITIEGNFSSHLKLERCSFFNYTGYCIYFDKGYGQNHSIRNILCDNCGGVIGGDGSLNPEAQKGLVVTGAIIELIDLEGGVNQISPKDVLVDLSGFREYVAKQIILEGSAGNNAIAVKVSNSRWNYLSGVHVEFGTNPPIIGVQVVNSLYHSASSNVVLESPAYPIVVSATNTNVKVIGFQVTTNDESISIIGEGSRVDVEDYSMYTPSFNVINPSILGQKSYKGIRLMTENCYPLDIDDDCVLFEWDATKGELINYANSYFRVSAVALQDVATKGIATKNDIGSVYEMTMVENPTYYRSPRLQIDIIEDRKPLLLGKKITISVAYRIVTDAPSVTAVGILEIEPMSYTQPLPSKSILNHKVYNDFATGICSVIVDDNFKRFMTTSVGASANNYKYALEISSIKIVVGAKGYVQMPIFLNS